MRLLSVTCVFLEFFGVGQGLSLGRLVGVRLAHNKTHAHVDLKGRERERGSGEGRSGNIGMRKGNLF